MANENEQGFAIFHPADGLWVARIIQAGGKWRWVLGTKEERGIYPTRMAACLDEQKLNCYCQGYKVVELEESA